MRVPVPLKPEGTSSKRLYPRSISWTPAAAMIDCVDQNIGKLLAKLEELGVAENTVKAQIRSLLKKSGARSLATLAQKVIKGATRDTVPPGEPTSVSDS